MRKFSYVLGFVFLAIFLVGAVAPGRAQEEERERAREEEQLREQERLREEERLRDRERILENEDKILGKYAERFGVDKEALADLRARRFGYGEISHALVLSKMTEKPLDEIVAMRDAGKGWGQIADELGVKLGEAKREVKRETRRIRSELTREERRTLRQSWKEKVRPGEEVGAPRPKYGEEKPGREYVPPERGRGRGGGKGR